MRTIWKTLLAISVVILAWSFMKWRTVEQAPAYPMYEMTFQELAKASHVGPWGMRHRNFGVYALRGYRPTMEDRFVVMDNEDRGALLYWAFGIFDGHGGSYISDNAEQLLMQAVTQRIQNTPTQFLNISQILYEEIIRMDEKLMAEGGAKKNLCGSTAVVGVRYRKKLYIANVGDSRAVAKIKEGSGIVETKDHKPGSPDETARIEAAGGSVRFDGYIPRLGGILALSRALGDAKLKSVGLIATPDLYVIDLERTPVEMVILGSDGLWDVFESREAIDYVEQHSKEKFLGAKMLAEEALRKGTKDNVCVMVIQFRDHAMKGAIED